MSAATPSAELHDRRQRAIEAGQDAVGWSEQYPMPGVIEAAVEAATRVRIDTAILEIAWKAYEARSAPLLGPDDPDLYDMLYAAFEAAGFEVEN